MSAPVKSATFLGTDSALDRPRYRQAERSLLEIDELLEDSLPTSGDYIVEMIHSIIGKERRRVVLYLGSGCSNAVEVDEVVGQSEYRGGDWLELLTGMLDRIPFHQRTGLLRSLRYLAPATAGSGTRDAVRELVGRFDKLRVAWFLGSHDGKNREVRDSEISSIVEPPAGAARQSRLYEELLKLPFDEIVTTNYDSNILWFLDNSGARCTEITTSSDLAPSLQKDARRRLFYLHGKAYNSPLVVDRFDYAELLAERDGMLDFVTHLLRDAHVIYVGFGLDDPSFNLIETRLQRLLGPYRPKSFAFMDHVTERERNMWCARNLFIIDYGADRHHTLPRILKRVNVIRRFFDWAEPDLGIVHNHRDDRTGKYRGDGLRLYVRGRFAESVKKFRAALASTLFWERELGPGGVGRNVLPFDRAVNVCELRIRLAMNHYKLQAVSGDGDDHEPLFKEDIDEAKKLIRHMQETIASTPPCARAERDRVLLGLVNSLKVLESRALYHNGKFSEATRLLEDVLDREEPPILERQLEDDHAPVIAKLKLAETFYYAKCHKSRIDYQYLQKSGNDSNRRISEVKMLDHLGDSIRLTRNYVEDYRKSCGSTAEWEYYLNSFGTIQRIAQWTAGRHALRVCEDIIPIESERSQQVLEGIDLALALLNTDPITGGENTWRPSGRWSAMRHRYRCRGYGLRWLLRRFLEPDQTHEEDLVVAYDALQDALSYRGGGLERQVVLNLLEAARLNVVVMFGEQAAPSSLPQHRSTSPLTLAACVYYLDQAFDAMESVPESLNEKWVQILGYRLASYFAVLSRGRFGAPEAKNADLVNFLARSIDDMIGTVKEAYEQLDREFLSSRDRDEMRAATTFERRTSYYIECIAALRRELRV